MKALKLVSILTFLSFAAQANAAEKYLFDKNHTNITWSANHFGFSNPNGKFTDTDGYVLLDEKDPSKSVVEITIKIASLETGLKGFNEHLKGSDFFNLAKFPTAKFSSKKVDVVRKGKKQPELAKVHGELTLLGVTKPVVLDVKLNKIGVNPYSKLQTAGFTANTTIKRSEFGINYAIPGVSDEVKISIEAEVNLESQVVSKDAAKK